MKIIIIEDEAPAFRRLIKLISECDQNAEVIQVIQSVKEGLEWFRNNEAPDLILSDIQLADDLSFTIFRELKITTPIIFITAYDEYAINAFKFYSIDYLLKPVSVDDLRAALDKYKNIHKNTGTGNFDELIRKITEKQFRERFLVYQGDCLIPVKVEEVAYFMSEDGETMLITNGNKRYFIGESLDTLENELSPEIFFRANRQYILSTACIRKIHQYGQQKLKIITEPASRDEIIVSKLRSAHFKRWLNK